MRAAHMYTFMCTYVHAWAYIFAQDDAEDSLAARLAQKYYSRLFKEYCIADLSRYKESKLGLRCATRRQQGGLDARTNTTSLDFMPHSGHMLG